MLRRLHLSLCPDQVPLAGVVHTPPMHQSFLRIVSRVQPILKGTGWWVAVGPGHQPIGHHHTHTAHTGGQQCGASCSALEQCGPLEGDGANASTGVRGAVEHDMAAIESA
eukprot:CAMPEP_0174733124 /NCGR_PEP_ID=MMETSP1094-20130205/60682_1 /TAXON_ID=156173 /ORGANISM="Chrysochromulina brevifilum, Strain UTEX LB 985" /LENGTH=109 /DNA_ID=CAMNT_0015935743 /DNA_START=202 /DNA_END=531 /DNA_ORIENTATION=+